MFNLERETDDHEGQRHPHHAQHAERLPWLQQDGHSSTLLLEKSLDQAES